MPYLDPRTDDYVFEDGTRVSRASLALGGPKGSGSDLRTLQRSETPVFGQAVCTHCGAGAPCTLSSWCRHPAAVALEERHGPTVRSVSTPGGALGQLAEQWIDGNDPALIDEHPSVAAMRHRSTTTPVSRHDMVRASWACDRSARVFLAQPDVHPLAE